MTQQFKSLQDIMRERRLKDIKRDKRNYRFKQYWTAIKRLSLITLLGYYGAKAENRQTLKSFLKSASAPIEHRVNDFSEGMHMIRDTMTPRNSQASEAFHQQEQRKIKEYRQMGIDPVIKYAKPGTKEYREALEFYRKEGVFKD